MSDVYQIITEQIVKKLEAGTCPWRMPWAKMGGNSPKNIKGNEYRGCNFFLLSMLGFSDPVFLTYKQAQALGGNVRKGEKGFPVIFWKILEREDEGKVKKIPMLKYYTVFNVSQCDGINYVAPVMPERPDFNGIEAADRIVTGFDGPAISHGGDRACYSPAFDRISMPHRAQFIAEGEYYSTLFHELGHSTGHKSRLDRKELGADSFGSHAYSTEELTAELCAAFLCAEAQIDGTLDNSAAYLASWLRKLKDDPKVFVTAAGKAQKAANFILNNGTAASAVTDAA